MARICASRMQAELKELERSPIEGVRVHLANESSLMHLNCELDGPPDTPFEGGTFKLSVDIPEHYPMEPPHVRFVTPVYHPNIDDGGRICLDILKTGAKGAWKPSLKISSVLLSIGLLLGEANPDDGLMNDISREYKHNHAAYAERARAATRRFAMGAPPEGTPAEAAPSSEQPQGASSGGGGAGGASGAPPAAADDVRAVVAAGGEERDAAAPPPPKRRLLGGSAARRAPAAAPRTGE